MPLLRKRRVRKTMCRRRRVHGWSFRDCPFQAIQDQIVRGSASARAKLPKLIELISERLLAVAQDVWRDPRNARAAVIYTLSGGQARVIRKVIEFGLSPEPELALMHGALAYPPLSISRNRSLGRLTKCWKGKYLERHRSVLALGRA